MLPCPQTLPTSRSLLYMPKCAGARVTPQGFSSRPVALAATLEVGSLASIWYRNPPSVLNTSTAPPPRTGPKRSAKVTTRMLFSTDTDQTQEFGSVVTEEFSSC